MRTVPILVALLGLALPARGDVLLLRGGGQVSGAIVAETPDRVTIEVGPGQVAVARDRISEIRRGSSPLDEYRRRSMLLAPDDTQGWLALAQWARRSDLATQAREAFEHVIRLDPTNSVAQVALGNVLQGGQWMSQQDAFRARGYIELDGKWVTPEEHRARMEERRLELEEARLASATRVAEAEARAREAEAEARAREAEAATDTDSAVVWWAASNTSGARVRRRAHRDPRAASADVRRPGGGRACRTPAPRAGNRVRPRPPVSQPPASGHSARAVRRPHP